MSAKRVSIISAFAVLVCVAFGALELTQPLAYVRLCNLCRDAIARSGRKTPPNPDLVFLAIDAGSVSVDESDINEFFGLSDEDESTPAYALRLISKGYPWSREVYALVLQRLIEAGAKTVIFDLTFPTSTNNDPLFRKALDRYSDRVVIGSNFVDGSLVRPCDTLITQSSPTDSRIGFTNFGIDGDAVVRRAQFRLTLNDVREEKTETNPEIFVSLAADALIKSGRAADIPNDLDAHAIRFTGPPREGFPPRSLYSIFVPAYWEQNYESGEFFRDKIVIVGAEGNWQHDDHLTPFGEMPGPELHLNALNAALHHEFIGELPPLANLAGILLAGVLAVMVALVCRNVWVRLVLVLLIAHASILSSLLCFNGASLYLPIIAPVTVFCLTTLIGMICDFASERAERRRVRRVLERYVSRDVVHELVDHPDVYRDSLGGVTKPVSILFSDIRSYSTVTARSSPETLVAQLNEYFSAMVDCVFENGGTLDKFIGDALMASWGSLDSRGGQADTIAAIRAALAMKERLHSLNKTWKERGWPELRVGMAVNHGEVVVGNIGSPQRMEFALIGDAVNVTWKLQELTKTKGANLIVSESVVSLIGNFFDVRSLGLATVDGSHQPCEIFSVGNETEFATVKNQIRNESWHAGAAFGQQSSSATLPAAEAASVDRRDFDESAR